MSVSFLNAALAPIECIPTSEKMDKPAQPSLKVTISHSQALVRGLSYHHCDPGSIPGPGITVG